MAESTRERRIRNEAALLREMVALNPEQLQMVALTEDEFRMTLHTAAHGGSVHGLKLAFAPYFPAVPIEAYLEVPVRHPNVHPVTGFICLWDKHSTGDTVIEALRQTQRVLSGELRNSEADHLMQPESLDIEPLVYEPLRLPEGYLLEREARGFAGPKRPRLTAWTGWEPVPL